MRGEEIRGRAAIGGRESERRVPMPRHRADGSAAPGVLVSRLLDAAERDGCWRGSCTVQWGRNVRERGSAHDTGRRGRTEPSPGLVRHRCVVRIRAGDRAPGAGTAGAV